MSYATPALPKILAVLILLAAAAALTWFAALPTPTAQAQTITDYDLNDNGLIDISSIAQLNAIRHDPNGDGVASDPAFVNAFPDRATTTGAVMGCPTGTCTGYELTTNLTFASTSTWAPIPTYSGTLDGAGHTITGLNISGTINFTNLDVGMFRALTASATIRDLGLVDADVNINASVVLSAGILAGEATSSVVISNVYARGGRIRVSGNSAGLDTGGLVGELRGDIRASYSTAAIDQPGISGQARPTGGLVGDCAGCAITASYAAGPVSGTGVANTVNGLIGTLDAAGLAGLTNSYCDTEATGRATCISPEGNSTSTLAAFAATTAQLQTPTGYTGPFLNWNIDTDDPADGLPNYPWNFRTSSQYPVLYTPDQRAAATPATMDYDANDNDRIDIHTIAQLNALRWDPDGEGSTSTGANAPAYSTAFAGHAADMGCPATCAGYELAADLTFPATGADSLWTPIATYNNVLDGNNRRITDLKVVHSGNAGLFAQLGGSSTIRNLALINPNVTLTATSSYAGALVGLVPPGGAVIESVAVVGGRVVIQPATTTSDFSAYDAGGLAGWLRAGNTIRNSYAAAEVASAFVPTNGINRLGGLVSQLDGELINSYAYGPITYPDSGFNFVGGLVGQTSGNATSTASYCDVEIAMLTDCVGNRHANFGASTTAAIPKTTLELQTPVGYTGIYQDWAPADTSTLLWNFGAETDYPRLHFAPVYAPPLVTDSPPPGGPREAQPPQDTPYDPAADHPEIYENPRYEMAAACQVQTRADGTAESSQITFDLGAYRGEVILHLAVWNGEYFTSYESQDIPIPDFRREGQTATVRVTTDPATTRFLLDSVSPTTNLVLGYADCHTDDPGAESATADPPDAATTSTAPTPKVYANDQYEMTASCEVQHNADGEPDGAVIRFDLGRYQDPVILHLSQWNGEYYASYESLDIDLPPFQRTNQQATVQVTTNPTQTRFLLNSVSPTMNLLLGYADCHTAGE